MNENRTPPARAAAAEIIIEDGNRVVKAVLAPKRFRTCRIGQPDGAVVVAVEGRIAPAKPGTQRPSVQRRARTPQTVRPEIEPYHRPKPARACPIALALHRAHAAFSNGNREMQVLKPQYSGRGAIRERKHPRQGTFSYSVSPILR